MIFFIGSMTLAHLYLGSTHIDDTKNSFLSSHTIMSLTHIIDKLSLLISKYNVSFIKYKVILYVNI